MKPGLNIITVLAIIVIVLTVPVLYAAEENPTEKSAELKTLADCLRFAAKNNAGLKAAFNDWKGAIEAVPQAGTLPDPRFTYTYFIEEVETRVGPQESKIGFSQTFPWFGKLEARSDAAAAYAKAAQQKYEAKKLALFYDVKNSYYEYSYLSTAIKETEQNLELLKHFEQVALTRYAAAAGSQPDVIRAQIELAQLEDKLTSLKEMRGPIVARLNSVLNRQINKDLPWPEKPVYEDLTIDRNKVIAKLNKSNPEIGAMTHEIEAAKEGVTLAEKRFYPDVTFGVDWIQTGDAAAAGVKDSGKDPILAMFSVNIPLWADSYRAGLRQAKANLRKATAEKKQKQNELDAEVVQALFEFDDSARKIKLYSDILIPKANEMLEASEAAYKAGSIDFLSLVDAQQTQLAFGLVLERAITDNLQSSAMIEKIIGDDVAESTNDQGL